MVLSSLLCLRPPFLYPPLTVSPPSTFPIVPRFDYLTHFIVSVFLIFATCPCHFNHLLLSFIVCQVGVPILEQQLASITIPDVSGSTSIDVVGRIDYSLSK